MSGGHPPRTVNTFPVDTFPGSIDHALIDEPHKKTKTMEKTTEACGTVTAPHSRRVVVAVG